MFGNNDEIPDAEKGPRECKKGKAGKNKSG